MTRDEVDSKARQLGHVPGKWIARGGGARRQRKRLWTACMTCDAGNAGNPGLAGRKQESHGFSRAECQVGGCKGWRHSTAIRDAS